MPDFSVAMRIQNGGGSAILPEAAKVIKQIEAAMKPDVPFSAVVPAAREMRDRLDDRPHQFV